MKIIVIIAIPPGIPEFNVIIGTDMANVTRQKVTGATYGLRFYKSLSTSSHAIFF